MAIETSATQQSRRPRHNPENNNPIDNGRENLHLIIATRILQPADVSCFRPLKAFWKHGVFKWRRSKTFSQLTKTDFAPILNEIISDLVPESISNGFRTCGLCPWNVNAIDFTKCLGKQTNKGPPRDTLPTTSLSFDKFIKLIGPSKFEELRSISLNELHSFSEEFQILQKEPSMIHYCTSLRRASTKTRTIYYTTEEQLLVRLVKEKTA
jgi:hypothetical protein